MDLTRELDIAKNISKKAGREIMKFYRENVKMEYKTDNSPLTKADKVSNEIIVGELLEKFPDYSILSEERKDDLSRLKNEWCWIIDPLDGTKEFINRNGEFTVNIALAYKHRVVLGVIYIPAKEELYYAVKGERAYLEKEDKIQKIKVSNRMYNLRLAVSRSHSSEEEERLIERNKDKISEVKRAGGSLKGCMIAKGDAEVYYRFGPTMEWDTAAMQCIVEEAGGIFRQLDDTEMLYNRENSLNEKGFYILNRPENKLSL